MSLHREEEAAAQLADPAFRRRVRASLGMAVPSLAPKTRSWAAKPGVSRPKKIDPSHCSDEVSDELLLNTKDRHVRLSDSQSCK